MSKITKTLQNKALGDLNKMQQEAEVKQKEAITALKEDFGNIIDNQNEQAMALATIYAAIQALADEMQVKLPKPLVNMEIEE